MRLLSYPLGKVTPTYMENPAVQLEQVASIDKGDVANWFSLRTINHNGTHLDAPWHFNPHGKRLDQLAPESFFFTTPRLVDIPKDADELITDDDLRHHHDLISEADVLLVRTGFGSRHRNHAPGVYGQHGPGFAESAGAYVRQFPDLRCIAMDVISAGAPAHPDDGVAFHRAALGATFPAGAANPFVLLAEDCRLDDDLTAPDLGLVVMSPLILESADGAPITMVALSADDLAGLGLLRARKPKAGARDSRAVAR